MIFRVAHVIIQLQLQGYLDMFKKDDSPLVCEVTKIGKYLIRYIEL